MNTQKKLILYYKRTEKSITPMPLGGTLDAKLISSAIQTQINLHSSAIVESRNS